MPALRVEKPIPGDQAFTKTSKEATLSQAALLLYIGKQLRGDEFIIQARASAVNMEAAVEVAPADDIREFNPPTLAPTNERHGVRSVQANLESRFGRIAPVKAVVASDAKKLRKPLAELADRVYAEGTTESAANLLEAALSHPNELNRVAAASSYLEITTQPARLIKILEAALNSKDELTRDVAATSLARVAPDNPKLKALTKRRATKTRKPPSKTSFIVHGTWARGADWWQPGGDFHTYALQNVRPDLYSANDRFEWSGGYSDAARTQGATDLRDWVQRKGFNSPDIFAHSHGANISMLATQMGLNIGTLVLLSCPVHARYLPDFTHVQRTVSLRVRFDLVILADRGGQKFKHPNIEENVLPLWFDHSASHEPDVWKKHQVKAMLGL